MNSCEELNSILVDLSNHCEEIQTLKQELPIEKSISLLKLKNEIFLAYMKNMMFIVLLRSQGISIENHPSVKRLVEYRVVLERIRPLEHKLKFQIDRAVKLATEDIQEVDAEGLNARLIEMTENIEDASLSSDNDNEMDENEDDDSDRMEDDDEDQDSTEEDLENDDSEYSQSDKDDFDNVKNKKKTNSKANEEDDDYIDSDTVDGGPPVNTKKSKFSKTRVSIEQMDGDPSVYRPPKLNPAFYGDSKDGFRAQKDFQRAKVRAMRSSLLEDLREDNDGNPMETFETSSLMNKLQMRKEKERQTYEEEYFTRVTLSKKEKAEQSKLKKGDPLDKIGNFEEIRTLLGDDEYPELQFRKDGKKPTKKQKKRLQKQKSKGKGKSKSKKFIKMKRK